MKGFFNYDGALNRGMTKIMYMVSLNLLFILTSLPIVTIGASATALYTVLFRYIDDEEPQIVRTYFRAFRDNFKKSGLIWLILLAAGAVLALDGAVLGARTDSSFSSLLVPALIILFLVEAVILVYIFAAVAYFDNTLRGYFFYSFGLSIARLPQTILLMLIAMIPVVLLAGSASFGFILIPIFLCCGVSLPAYLAARILCVQFRTTSGKQEELHENREVLL